MHRWERLFADLEAQFDESERGELWSEVADRTRAELAKLRVADRLRAVAGSELAVWSAGGAATRGTVRSSGPDWLLLVGPNGAETVVALAAVLKITGLGRRASVPGSEGRLAGRLRLSYVLRGIARDRAAVTVTLVDGSTVVGVVDRVGADHIDLSMDRIDLSMDRIDLSMDRIDLSTDRIDLTVARAERGGAAMIPFSALALVRRAP
ncbi:MAG TPA: hypothetical protein VFZ85_09625 [Jiangellaceae bacterium]